MDSILFRSLYPDLRRFAAIYGAPVGDPDDLVQEAVARTLALHQLADLDNPAAYIRKAIVNATRNQARIRRTEPPAEDVSVDAYPSDLSLLDSLGADERAAVYLLDVEQYQAAEAAEILGCSVAALKSRARRGRRKLRRIEGESDAH